MVGGPRVSTAVLALCVAALAGAAAADGSHAAPVPLQHVTVIGDSVADALQLDARAQATVTAGAYVELELEPCRRLVDDSCPNQAGIRPPTVAQLIQAKGAALGPNVVMAVGYNDPEDTYATAVDSTLAALQAIGVQHVFWLTLAQVRHPYVSMDDDIYAAAAKHPGWMTVIDWNAYARGHADWFAYDGLHLAATGAEAMARLIHSSLVDAGVAVEPARPPLSHVKVATFKLPLAVLRHRYSAKLTASGGRAPYSWSVTGLPRGLRLLGDGSVVGRPLARAGLFHPSFVVTDAAGKKARRSLALTIR